MTRTNRAPAAFLVGLLAFSIGCAEKPKAPTDAAAYASCQRFVKEQLKSPASAVFPTNGVTTTRSFDVFEVRTFVDSQNGFGATVRTPFTCSVEWLTDELYNLKDLKMGKGQG